MCTMSHHCSPCCPWKRVPSTATPAPSPRQAVTRLSLGRYSETLFQCQKNRYSLLRYCFSVRRTGTVFRDTVPVPEEQVQSSETLFQCQMNRYSLQRHCFSVRRTSTVFRDTVPVPEEQVQSSEKLFQRQKNR